MDRQLLHCDLNNFYASVECLKNPELRGKAVAVCGEVELRHGVILAKNELAKSFGVKTGEPLWQAVQKCPQLVAVPPQMELYTAYSKKAMELYYRYTDRIEPFGIDECWLDVTGSQRLYGSGESIAHQIRMAMKAELGLTISVGVSFTKSFAKLGSDYKKPDAVTLISRENFRALLGPLPVETLLNVGPATKRTLNRCGISTIGQLAAADPACLEKKLGKNGLRLSVVARGEDRDEVRPYGCFPKEKSIGNGFTAPFDLETPQAVSQMLLSLAECVGRRLRQNGLSAGGVALTVKNKSLKSYEISRRLGNYSDITQELHQAALALFLQSYTWEEPVRALTLRTYDLCENGLLQGGFWEPLTKRIQSQQIDRSVDALRARYGVKSVLRASLLDNPLDRINAYTNEGHPWAHPPQNPKDEKK